MSASKVAEGVEVPDGSREAAVGPFTHYPKHPTADDVYFISGAWAPAAITAVDKRFSQGELAAEFHANEIEAWRMCSYRPEFYDVDRAERLELQSDVLRRFATLPHHDEERA